MIVVRCNNIIFYRNPKVNHELTHRVFLVGTNIPNVIRGISRMNSAGRIHQNRDSSRWLDGRDCRGLWDSQLCCPFFICINGNLLENIQSSVQALYFSVCNFIILNPSKTDSEQPFLFGILCPCRRKILEFGQRGLKSSNYGRNANLSLQVCHCVRRANHYLGQITESLWSKDNLSTRIDSEIMFGISSFIFHDLLLQCCTTDNAALPAL